MAIDKTSKVYYNTPMIRMSDMKYPVYLSDFLKENTNVSIGDFVWEYDLAEIWKYFKVHDTEMPEGDVVTEGEPEYNPEDELWYKTWQSRDFTPEEIADNLATAKEVARIRSYQKYNDELSYGINVSGDVFNVETQELVNLQAVREFAIDNPETTILLRKFDYSTLDLTATEAVDKIGDIFVAVGKVQQNLVAHIKTVYESTVIADIPEVPATFIGE